MSKGKVKFFNDRKGYGFISGPDSDKGIYVHYTAINVDGYRSLEEGQEVFYELTMDNNYPAAKNVVPNN
jgi:CspA family cold shock protein